MDLHNCSKEGLIVDQSLLSSLKNGCFGSDRNGCGWIAVYNTLRLLGEQTRPEWVLEDLRHGLVLGGRFGTHVFFVQQYLRRRGFRVRLNAIPARFAAVARTADACILLYRHRKGNHFATLCKEVDRFHFYNALSGAAQDVRTMEDFLETERQIPPCLLIAVNKRIPKKIDPGT